MFMLPYNPVPGHRYLQIYSVREHTTEFDVIIDSAFDLESFQHQQTVDPYHSDLGTVAYQITLPHDFLGVVPVTLKLLSGSMTLTRARCFYPCLVTNSAGVDSWHWYALFQPIPDPKWLVKINGILQTLDEHDNHLTGEIHHNLTAGDVMTYLHAAFDGPQYWWVKYNAVQPPLVIDSNDPNIQELNWDRVHRLTVLKNQLMVNSTN